MKFPNPIEITVVDRKGQSRTQKISDLPLSLVDNDIRKTVVARLAAGQPIVLWEGEAYEAVGDYTQAQAEARILEILGGDLAKSLEDILKPRS